MMPETFDSIGAFAPRSRVLGIEVLVEIHRHRHRHHQRQIEIEIEIEIEIAPPGRLGF